jgi:transcriptional regulator with XRE-family HTH domain
VGGDDVTKENIGRRIKEARAKRGLTQEQLAEKTDITIVYLSELERGVKLPSLTVFVNIAEALHVSTDSLLRDDLETGKEYIYDDLTKKLERLTPKQRIAIADIVDAYIRNL